ncbi:hypothetical protein HOY82DRAFT_607408 [Tuber indicum]|nr:hypothetical protein HOY82DRAFT_607408 [Tuber indicum]
MPARRLTFTRENILRAWEAVGIIPFNPRRAIGSVKQKEAKVTQGKGLADVVATKIPKTPRAVSRISRTAASLVTKTTPTSLKLKELLSNLAEGFQQTIADKVMEEEAHRQYRELIGKEKKKNTSDRRKLTEATVVTSETIRMLRKERERVDATKAARIASHRAPSGKTASTANAASSPNTCRRDKHRVMSLVEDQVIIPDDGENLWEEMEALEIAGDSSSEESGGVVGDVIRVEKRQ